MQAAPRPKASPDHRGPLISLSTPTPPGYHLIYLLLLMFVRFNPVVLCLCSCRFLEILVFYNTLVYEYVTILFFKLFSRRWTFGLFLV